MISWGRLYFAVIVATYVVGCGQSEEPAHELKSSGPRTFDSTVGALFQPSLLMGSSFREGDRIVNIYGGSMEAHVESSNLEHGEEEFDNARCVLEAAGFSLGKTENGVYWANWSDEYTDGLTLKWIGVGGDRLSYTLINSKFREIDKNEIVKYREFLVTLYHEIKGHNVDDQDHEGGNTLTMNQFEKLYEEPVYQKIGSNDELRRLKSRCGA